MALVVGALPAEYGLRTVGLIDITTRADIFNNSGLVSLYGGSQGNLYTTIGTSSDVLSHSTVDALPGGTNTPVERIAAANSLSIARPSARLTPGRC
jgi:hypothetical protein